eukprot:GHVR01034253.1.p1 GENE.GHVR01034253.1~~GHVR01034253.1.p1  ORF type:complete len:102 (+),score=2.52 GHVR01034253.1:973-1278(+)
MDFLFFLQIIKLSLGNQIQQFSLIFLLKDIFFVLKRRIIHFIGQVKQLFILKSFEQCVLKQLINFIFNISLIIDADYLTFSNKTAILLFSNFCNSIISLTS